MVCGSSTDPKQPDLEEIYLALRNVFRDLNARARTPEQIRALVEIHQDQPDIRNLIAEWGIEKVCGTAKVLLVQKVFQSISLAQTKFPNLLTVTAFQREDRAFLEAEPSRSEEIKPDTIAKKLSGIEEQDIEIEKARETRAEEIDVLLLQKLAVSFQLKIKMSQASLPIHMLLNQRDPLDSSHVCTRYTFRSKFSTISSFVFKQCYRMHVLLSARQNWAKLSSKKAGFVQKPQT